MISKHLFFFFIPFIPFFFIFDISATGIPPQNELDSIKNEIARCNSDTCSFNILQRQFWKHRSAGSDYSEFYGEWAFETIKNSADRYGLSNGYDIKSTLVLDENKIDSARYYLIKALVTSKSIGFSFRIAWSYYNLGKIADKMGNLWEAIAYYKLAKQNFKNVRNFDTPDIEINNDIGYGYARLRCLDSAMIYFQYNIQLAKENSDRRAEIYISLDISNYFRNTNYIKKSIEFLYKALKIAENLKDDDVLSDVYFQVGNYFFEQKKNYPIARNYYERALELTEKSIVSKQNGTLYIQIGKTNLEEGRDSIALGYALKGLAISKQINYRHSLSNSYENLGYVYKHLGEYDLAIDNFKKCWQTQCDFCPPISFHNALMEIACLYMKRDDYTEAFYWYVKSLKLAEDSKSKTETAKSKFAIGDYYRKKREFARAEINYLQSFEMAIESENFLLIRNIADTLSNFYYERNNYKAARDYLKIAGTMADSLFKIEKQSGMASLEMNFEFEKLKKENEAKEATATEEIKRQKLFRNFLVVISALIAALGTVVFISYRRKNKDNQLLKLQKSEIEAKNTEIYKQIEEISKQKDEISTQKDEIEKISKQLHEADQMKLKFFTNVSHEFRTPLALIISPLVRLLKNREDEETRNLYSIMLRNTRKLQALISQLLDISRLDKNELKLNLGLYDFSKLVRTIAAMFQSIAEERNIDFRIIEKQKDVKFCFDAERIDQVIKNLLSNAFKFTPENGQIILKVDMFDKPQNLNSSNFKNGYVEVKIRDNGVGIPAESINKIFDRFYQTKSTLNRNFEGSGIGLSLAKEFVDLHGGHITVQSEAGKWTEFIVLLPFVTSGEEDTMSDNPVPLISEDNFLNIQKKEGKQAVSRKSKTILLVEDNRDLQVYLRNILSVKYNVLQAENGTEGVDTALKKIPDVVISDVMMPDKDGFQLTSALKKNNETCHIPIILLTAKAGHESKIEGLERGADDYINKPFDEEELMLKLRNILRNRQKMQEKYRKQITVNPADYHVESIDEQFLANLCLIIENELSNPSLGADFICKKIGISHSQLNRKLNALINLSINQFIRSLRLKRAAQLLNKKAATISEIAYMSGFENLSYFTKKFKEEFGILPSEYS